MYATIIVRGKCVPPAGLVKLHVCYHNSTYVENVYHQQGSSSYMYATIIVCGKCVPPVGLVKLHVCYHNSTYVEKIGVIGC